MALKILTEAGRDREDFVLRFQAEAGLLRRIGGRRHLIRCDSVIAVPPTQVLELYEESVADRLEQGPLPLRVAIQIARQGADALGWLHEHGVLHRDVKSSNLLIAMDGTVALADLGVAAQGSPPRGLPDEWVEEDIGTLGYAAPEQLRDPAAATPASDVFGLAVVLFEMLIGVLPWSMESEETEKEFRERAAAGLPVPPLDRFPAPVARVLSRALDPRPEARQASGNELLGELARLG